MPIYHLAWNIRSCWCSVSTVSLTQVIPVTGLPKRRGKLLQFHNFSLFPLALHHLMPVTSPHMGLLPTYIKIYFNSLVEIIKGVIRIWKCKSKSTKCFDSNCAGKWVPSLTKLPDFGWDCRRLLYFMMCKVFRGNVFCLDRGWKQIYQHKENKDINSNNSNNKSKTPNQKTGYTYNKLVILTTNRTNSKELLFSRKSYDTCSCCLRLSKCAYGQASF